MEFVKPWFKRFDLGVCEVKSPGAKNAGVFSNHVKLGLDMKEMLISLIKEGLDDARVCSFLVKGYNIDTYVMDLQHPPIYRMTLLSSTRLPDSVATFSLFPSLFRNVLHIKNIASSVAYRTDALQSSKSKGKQKAKSISTIIKLRRRNMCAFDKEGFDFVRAIYYEVKVLMSLKSNELPPFPLGTKNAIIGTIQMEEKVVLMKKNKDKSTVGEHGLFTLL
ncbi:hypothetical protein EC973_003129 [Apophysomyces ossiformis]|uniref:Uncharacterized protein n=1 Tax=Apophysomyces ossiformis TaxID=679940 RepID=A0A8H7BHI1_9FUNG|nr:hypothetical protein EC973_003129 [Apophysomyces ossiformis]